MSDIVLSASVRQNLLSLQSTADLLATTQNRLSTGNKVNTALDNPTNYFTAQSLNNRASDISNLLDGIGNGVQVLQAANTGITSLQKLVDSAKSVANQALQASVGYSTKSSISTGANAGATADDLLGGVASNAVATGTGAITTIDLTSGAATNAAETGSVAITSPVAASSGSLTAAGVYSGNEFKSSDAISIGGTTINFDGTTDGSTAIADTTTHKYTEAEAISKINTDLAAASSTITATAGTGSNLGKIVLTDSATGTSSNFTVDTSGATTSNKTGGFGASATATGGAAATGGIDVSGGAKAFTIAFDGGAATTVTLSATGGTNHDGHYSADDVKTAINSALTSASVTGLTASVGTGGNAGKLILTSSASTKGTSDTIAIADVASSGLTSALGLSASTAGTAATDLTFKVNNQTVTLAGGSTYTGAQVASAIQTQVGTSAGVTAAYTSNKLVVTSTGTAGASDAVTVNNFSSGDATQLGFAAATETDHGSDNSGGLSGLTLTIGATGNGTATNITFGTGAGQVKSLNDLNAQISSNNLLATIDATGALTITTTNDAASSTIGTIAGTAAGTGKLFNGKVGNAPVADAAAQLVRSNLVDQYNNILDQIKTTAQDASYNGIDLLNGDQLKLTFNETGTSTLKIQGVNFDYTGLGLSKLSAGTDFLDNSSANSAINSLNTASSSLRTEASALGSNLSIVQIRQDFSKNLINVLQTGSSNLTLADTNEEAANSQALSTRQSIAVSALSLANQSQQSVLQLLR